MQQKANQKTPSAHGAQAEAGKKAYVPPRMHVIPLHCQLLAASRAETCMMPAEWTRETGGYFNISGDVGRQAYDRGEALCADPQPLLQLIDTYWLDKTPDRSNPEGISLRELLTNGTPRPDVYCNYYYYIGWDAGRNSTYTYYNFTIAYCYNNTHYRIDLHDTAW